MAIAGSEEERNAMMPLLYIDSHRGKSELQAEIAQVLKEFHHGATSASWLDPANRMKPLDVVKVLMGIMSSRDCVKRFQNDGTLWARRQEYDYNDVLKVATASVHQFYCEQLTSKRVH